jgi:hypothetical protein
MAASGGFLPHKCIFYASIEVLNIKNCTRRLKLDFYVNKSAENVFAITLGIRESISNFAIEPCFKWSPVMSFMMGTLKSKRFLKHMKTNIYFITIFLFSYYFVLYVFKVPKVQLDLGRGR